jgi:hypothetical protein
MQLAWGAEAGFCMGGEMLRKILLMAAGVGLTITANPQNASAQAIYACTTTTGTLYVVSAGTTCPGGRPLLTWSVTGPQGPPGPTERRGQPGQPGQQGQPAQQGRRERPGPQALQGASRKPPSKAGAVVYQWAARS